MTVVVVAVIINNNNIGNNIIINNNDNLHTRRMDSHRFGNACSAATLSAHLTPPSKCRVRG